MCPVVQKIESIQFEWKSMQDNLRQSKLTAKEQKALNIENRKLNILDDLKAVGGPFTDSSQVDEYIRNEKDPKKSQMRMKNEIVYYRDSSRPFPRASILFKIMMLSQRDAGR